MPNCQNCQKREYPSHYTGVRDLQRHPSLPNMSDTARKRTLADWVVQTKKQVVKLYAVVKWARDADVVQKAMVHLHRGTGKCSSMLIVSTECNSFSHGPEPPI